MSETKPSAAASSSAPDQAERVRALDPSRSFVVQAPAGSGKTHLLTQRFLRLLGQAEKPDEIVAITFTNAAAAEMRHRILAELERAEADTDEAVNPGLRSETWGTRTVEDSESLAALARRALHHAKRMGWQILDQPNQLRITTIDAFCRGLALQSPLSWGLLSGLGGRLDPVENAAKLYRLAATRTLKVLEGPESSTRRSVEALLLWRDDNWKDVEELILQMLSARNRWHQEFVFALDADWEALRHRLEAPFRRAARQRVESLCHRLDTLSGCREFALDLARLACRNGGKNVPMALAERAELPSLFAGDEPAEALALMQFLEDAVEAYRDLANFLLTKEGTWRKKGGLNVHNGFPTTAEGKAGKERFSEFVESLALEPGLLAALAGLQEPVPVRYSDEEWELVRHCFAVLREAALQLQVVFAETGSVDFTQVAQIALDILAPENGFPSDFAIAQADSIRHLLIDEFQDTSRKQHTLLSRLIGAWPEREGRSCFCVGDPMQSIYGFRDAEVELFERVKAHGIETPTDPDSGVYRFDFVSLRANFRTAPSLVNDLNVHFERIFQDGGGDSDEVRFAPAEAVRASASSAKVELHLAFTRAGKSLAASEAVRAASAGEPEITRAQQLEELVALVRSKLETMSAVRSAAHPENAGKYRIAILGRTRASLIVVAEALRKAGIGFRSIDLVKLDERPEVLDVLALARALLNPTDRTAWLGVLRAPWCGLSLAELHLLTSADDAEITATAVPDLLATRLPALFERGLLDERAYRAGSRVSQVLNSAATTRAEAASLALGTWLESVWKALGGGDTVDAEQRENLRVLWAQLDQLKDGELELTGPGLAAALDDLYALPDPAASSDFGVQLMTIHKSKGLEFEVVIVPDLEVDGKKYDHSLMSWLERGVTDPAASEESTEFLIAPIQTKGSESGAARAWVERVKRERNKDELRRLLYVASTRAREELHLFARPRFREKALAEGSVERKLDSPKGLLATAWPAFEDTILNAFDDWVRGLETDASRDPALGTLSSLAAEASGAMPIGNLLQMPSPVRPTRLKRLPENYIAPGFRRTVGPHPPGNGFHANERDDAELLFERTEGGLHSRLMGTAIHALLEESSRLRQTLEPDEAASALADSLPRIVANMRSHGLPARTAQQLAEEALSTAQESLLHPVGRWILTPHPKALSEVGWTGLVHGQTWNIRPDRVFFAPPYDHPEYEPVWWIIDYKSSHGTGPAFADAIEREAWVREHRAQYQDQLAVYAEMLRGLRGQGEGIARESLRIFAGVYYPRLQFFDWWEA